MKSGFEILLVEDDAADIRLLQEALRESRIESRLSVTRNGIEALAFLRGEGEYAAAPRPDLILLDLNLPKKSGREVLAEIKTDPVLVPIPVIILSTSTSEEDVSQAYSLNANCYIVKPMDLDQFFEIVGIIEEFWLRVATLPRHKQLKRFS